MATDRAHRKKGQAMRVADRSTDAEHPAGGSKRPARCRRRLAWLSVTAWATFVAAAATAATPQLETIEARPFGYTLGDTLERRLVLRLPAPLTLADAALPIPGRLGAGLELRSVTRERRDEDGTVRHDIRLRYQIFAAPVQVRAITLPAVHLALTGGPSPTRLEAPEFAVFVAPLVAEPFVPTSALGVMRPDAAVVAIETRGTRQRLAALAGAALLLALHLLWRQFGDLFVARRRGPFAAAWRDLHAIAAKDQITAWHRSLKRLHRAFDETAGTRVFAEGIDAFLAAHPEFAGQREAINAFYAASRLAFFAPAADGVSPDPTRLHTLCRACRAIERAQR
jgi:mxaA protein